MIAVISNEYAQVPEIRALEIGLHNPLLHDQHDRLFYFIDNGKFQILTNLERLRTHPYTKISHPNSANECVGVIINREWGHLRSIRMTK